MVKVKPTPRLPSPKMMGLPKRVEEDTVVIIVAVVAEVIVVIVVDIVDIADTVKGVVVDTGADTDVMMREVVVVGLAL